MPFQLTGRPRRKDFHTRLSEEELGLIQRAASLTGHSASSFMRFAAVEKAKNVLAEHEPASPYDREIK